MKIKIEIDDNARIAILQACEYGALNPNAPSEVRYNFKLFVDMFSKEKDKDNNEREKQEKK